MNQCPELLDAAARGTAARLAQLRRAGVILELVDLMPQIARELFRVEYPFVSVRSPEYQPTLARYLERHWHGEDYRHQGVWAVYPWRRAAVHLPGEDDYRRLRLARNRLLITDAEQAKAANSTVAVAGLSIGLSVVVALVLTGTGADLRLADSDTLEPSNLNRMNASVGELGLPKTVIAARRVTEVDPFVRVRTFPEGMTGANLERILDGANVLVEETDDLWVKIQARFAARRMGVPVVMATDDGEGTIVDVERFDLEPARPLFHGAVDEASLRKVPVQPSLSETIRLGTAIVGADVAPRMQRSLRLVGTRLPAWPQLGTAAALSGAAAAYAARRIVTGAAMPSGRYRLSLEAQLDPTFHEPAAATQRERGTGEFRQALGALFGA